MKVLIGYDGSRCSEAALDDLQKAGLPENCEALILSVAETWFSPPTAETTSFIESAGNFRNFKPKESGGAFSEAETFSRHAQKRLQINFPNWKTSTRSIKGSPACEILRCAADFEPDLIVVGSHGNSADQRFLMGSISQKVLTRARCSVRVARGRIEIDSFPVRIMIGFDGSEGSKEAVNDVISRHWHETVEIRLIAAADLIVPTAIGRFTLPVADWIKEETRSVEKRIEKLAEKELQKLRDAGFSATELQIYPGNPKQVLVEQAQKWDADCIFIGAAACPRRDENSSLGSTSAAVAERAHCSVEVVRQTSAKKRNIKV